MDEAIRRYPDRRTAGQVLAEQLRSLKGEPGLVVLAIPRGGVPVAAVVAEALDAPMDLLPARKLGAPGNAEFAIGAVAGDVDYVDQELVRRLGIPEQYVQAETARQRARSQEQRQRMLGDRESIPLQGKTVIVVDDGVATGATLKAALQALRKRDPRRLIVAVPVGPAEALENLAQVADEVVCPLVPAMFWAVGLFYERFDQVSDEEVARLFAQVNHEARPASAG